MRVKTDGLSVTFTPEDDGDRRMLMAFANLDTIIDSTEDANTLEAIATMYPEVDCTIAECIDHLAGEIAADSSFDDDENEELN